MIECHVLLRVPEHLLHVQVIVFQPQLAPIAQTRVAAPQPSMPQQQGPAGGGLSSYAQMAAASVKAPSQPNHAAQHAHHQQQQQHAQQLQQQQVLLQQANQPGMPPQQALPSMQLAVGNQQQQTLAQQQQEQQQRQHQQQQPLVSRQPAYATGVSSLPPNMLPSSNLLDSHTSSHSDPAASSAVTHGQSDAGLAYQQAQAAGQVPKGWPLQAALQHTDTSPLVQQQQGQQQQQALGQDLDVWQAAAVEAQRARQMSASVPFRPAGAFDDVWQGDVSAVW